MIAASDMGNYLKILFTIMIATTSVIKTILIACAKLWLEFRSFAKQWNRFDVGMWARMFVLFTLNCKLLFCYGLVFKFWE